VSSHISQELPSRLRRQGIIGGRSNSLEQASIEADIVHDLNSFKPLLQTALSGYTLFFVKRFAQFIFWIQR
jgi:hypothetical protein